MKIFIGGTSTSGKTYLADKFIKQSKISIIHVNLDDIRAGLTDPLARYWDKYYVESDEIKYLKTVTSEQYNQDHIKQAEAFWPTIMEKVKETESEHAIFEGIYLFPHLVKRDFDFPGLYLIPQSIELVKKRLAKQPRWGETKEKQELEAQKIIEYEVPFLQVEAKKYNYPVIDDENEAYNRLAQLFTI